MRSSVWSRARPDRLRCGWAATAPGAAGSGSGAATALGAAVVARGRACGRVRSSVWSRAVGRVVARGRVRSSVWSRAVGRVVARGRACGHARSGVWSRAVEAPSSVWPRGAQSSLEGRARSRVWPLLPGPPCRYRSWGDRRAAMAAADDSAAAADDHTATATTAWSPSRWRALRPAQTRMTDILHPWPGAAAMGLAHGMHIGEGSQGRVTQLHWAYSADGPGAEARPRFDGDGPRPGAALAAKWVPTSDRDEEDVFWEVSNLRDLAGHPNIVRLWAAAWAPSCRNTVLIMELGVASLHQFTKQQGKLARGLARQFTQDLWSGVGACHSKGIIHRDVAPKNAIICLDGAAAVLKLCDFGASIKAIVPLPLLGRPPPSSEADSDTTRAPLRQRRCTVPYAAPEVLRGDGASPAADAWSAAVVSWELFDDYPYRMVGPNVTLERRCAHECYGSRGPPGALGDRLPLQGAARRGGGPPALVGRAGPAASPSTPTLLPRHASPSTELHEPEHPGVRLSAAQLPEHRGGVRRTRGAQQRSGSIAPAEAITADT